MGEEILERPASGRLIWRLNRWGRVASDLLATI
jgi:hypothetical protein